MSENMSIYEKVRSVPAEALKPILGGRLKGMSDINPMWRIKMLTELFGMCGIGWKMDITDRRLEKGAGNEIVCFVDINLYVKVDGEWSAPIPGMGGSSFIAQEKSGPYTSDECFKMAYTDAISVACKSLGFAADVYFEKDRTKYNSKENQEEPQNGQVEQQQPQPSSNNQPLRTVPTGQAGQSNDGISDGQRRMLYAKHNQSYLKGSFDRISDHLGYPVAKFEEVKRSDVNKLIALLDENKAS